MFPATLEHPCASRAARCFFFAAPNCWCALQALVLLDAGFRARRRDTFLCSAKETYPKERRPEGLPHHACMMRVPCASRENRRMRNSQSRCARKLRQGACFIRFSLRCSAAPTGGVGQPPRVSDWGVDLPLPLHSPSTAANPGNSRAPCLSFRAQRDCELCAAPGLARNAGDRPDHQAPI